MAQEEHYEALTSSFGLLTTKDKLVRNGLINRITSVLSDSADETAENVLIASKWHLPNCFFEGKEKLGGLSFASALGEKRFRKCNWCSQSRLEEIFLSNLCALLQLAGLC